MFRNSVRNSADVRRTSWPRRQPIQVRLRRLSLQELDRARNGRERVVILGSGWAGYTISRDLNARKFQVIVVSSRSYFVFTPLLASTSVGTIEFRTALEPVRSRKHVTEFFQGWVDSVDFSSKTLTIEEAVENSLQSSAFIDSRDDRHQRLKSKGQLFDMPYDKLIVAVGCYSQTFDVKGVKENSFFLKDVVDA